MNGDGEERRLPAEWEPHAGVIAAWPGRPSVWGPHLEAGRQELAELVRCLAASEVVHLAVPAADVGSVLVRELQEHPGVRLLEVPLDDCWARDISPVFVEGAATGALGAVDFVFNAWGDRFRPHDSDRAFGGRLATAIGVPCEGSPLVLEGGSISTDGRGTAVLVEPTILNPNRNPGWSVGDVESELRRRLGIERFIWLEAGLSEDTDTDGHVDNVAVFIRPGTILAQAPAPGMASVDVAQMRRNLDTLGSSTDECGRSIEVVEVPWLPRSTISQSRPASYLNLCFTNGPLVVPTTGSADDPRFAELISRVLPGRALAWARSTALAFGGGGPHCMTMQVPACADLSQP